MRQANPYRMPEGLPAYLSSDKKGFDALCALLSISTTRQKHAILNAQMFKQALKTKASKVSRHAKTSERVRQGLTALYSDPELRRNLWRTLLSHDEESSDPARRPIPSIEHEVLKKYDDQIFDQEPAVKDLVDCSDYCSAETVEDEWRAAAVVALPRIRNDVLQWGELSRERQDTVLMAAFATSTLLDDVRLLRWTAERVDDVSKELAFVGLAADPGLSENQSKPKADKENPPKADVLSELRTTAQNLSAAALRLAKTPPEDELFDKVSEYAGRIEEMREASLLEKAAKKVEAQVDQFATLLNEISAHVPWLANRTGKFLSNWRMAFSEGTDTEVQYLQIALDLAMQNAPTLAQDWGNATKKKEQARLSLQALENAEDDQFSSLDDREIKEDKYHAEIAKFGQEARKSRDSIIQVLRPPVSEDDEAEGPAEYVVETPRAHSVPQQDSSPPGDATPTPEPPSHAGDDSVAADTAEPEPAAPASATVAEPQIDPATTDQEESAPPPEIDGEERAKTLQGEAPEPFSELDRAVWTALQKGRPGLAHRIARLNEAVQGTGAHPTPDLLAAVALGSQISSSDEEIVLEFSRIKGAVLSRLDFGEVDEETKDALNLLVVSASLRPTLFAPQQTDAIALLRRVEPSGRIPAVYRFATAMAENAETLRPMQLDSSTLATVFDEGGWEDRLESHVTQVDQWRSVPAPSFPLRAAEHVWRHWMSKGVLAELMELICSDNMASVKRVGEIIEMLSNQKSMRTHFDRTRRNDLGHAVRKGVSGDVVTQMERHLEGPVSLAQNWLQLAEEKIGGGDWQKNKIASLCDDIRNYGETALGSLRQIQESDHGLPLRAATGWAIEAIETLGDHRLHEKGFENAATVSATELLSDDLVHVVGLPLDEFGEIDADTSDGDALSLLEDTDTHTESLVAAFDGRIANDDLLGAWLTWKRLSREDDPTEVERRSRLDVAVAARVRALKQDLYDISHKLEQSFFMGEVDLEDYGALNDSITDVRESLDKDDAMVLAAIKNAQSLSETVDRIFRACLEKAKEQISTQRKRLQPEQNILIETALRAEDLTQIVEYIGCLKDGHPIVTAEKDECASLRDFLALLDGIVEEREGRGGLSQATIVNRVKQRKDILGLSFSSLSAAQADRSATMLEAWYLMNRETPETPQKLHDFAARLGFVPMGVKEERGGTGKVFALRTEALRDRALCPVHSFGSTAAGHYRIILNDKAPARNHIIQAVGSDPNRPPIIFHFGSIARDDREWLRRWSVKNEIPFIVVDEALVLYLASLPADTLGTMFDCTLPSTCVEPFFTAAGPVPPESFFGREAERRNIMDRYGSCFVYGGRQLGKTALLHRAQAAFHDPEDRRIAHCIDLQKYAIGAAGGSDGLWQLLWDEFCSLGVATRPESGGRRGPERLARDFAEAVEAWLDTDSTGQILLLLDEADEFLKADVVNNFRESILLKGLMDATQRRFKVVFCGLHNVLRNTERANHPLAHFGEPICVGPLLGNGDQNQARALIKGPLAAAGYTFEKDTLATHILVWTNYYPSFIQLYGESLLRHLRESRADSFPRKVTHVDIEAARARDGFRDYIRQRFAFTLQLDLRYEVIAYAIAFEMLGTSATASGGLSTDETMMLAKEAWPEGFDVSRKEFSTLLLEMCGLGVLRRSRQNGRKALYAFRNPNVLSLLGNEEEILSVLEKKRTPPEGFEAALYHAYFPDDDSASARRGPLTFEQEGTLKRGKRVAVLCGTQSANLGSTGDFLGQRLDENLLKPLDRCMNPRELEAQLNKFRPGRDTYVCMVDKRDLWTKNWIDSSMRQLTAGKVGGKLRVVFQADAERLWDLVSELPVEVLEDQADEQFDWIGLHPWGKAFLSHWCENQNLHEATPHIDELLRLSGGWPNLLEVYAASTEKTWQARKGELEDYVVAHRAELMADFGIESEEARVQMLGLRECGRMTFADVAAYEDLLEEGGDVDLPSGTLRRRLFWAIHLGFAQDVGGAWRLNTLIDRVLADSDP